MPKCFRRRIARPFEKIGNVELRPRLAAEKATIKPTTKTTKTIMKNDNNCGQNLASQTGPENQPEASLPMALAYDIKQAAAKLNVSTRTIRRLLVRRKLTCCKLIGKKLIPREQIDNFLRLTCDKPNLN
jgi:excisionase family DNA binding protein